MARGGGRTTGGRRERARRAFAFAGGAAVGTVVVLALAFRFSNVAPPVWFGSPATFFACIAGLVAVPTFVVSHPRTGGTTSLLRRLLVATLGGGVGAGLVLVTTAAMSESYDPMAVSMWLPVGVGVVFALTALLLS